MGSLEGNGYESYESRHDNGNGNNNASTFEFPKGGGGDRAIHHRPVLGSHSKPTPSKWDDAQKWLVSLSSEGGDHGYVKNKSKTSDAQRKISFLPRQGKSSAPNASEALSVPSSLPAAMDEEEGGLNQDEGDTKKIDYGKSMRPIDKPIADPVNEHLSYIPPTSNVRSVSMRDMGTEMTPMASQEPSRTGTPLRATTPSSRSPVTSRPSTPGRCTTPTEAIENYQLGLKDHHDLSEKQVHEKTRREIMALGAQLGKSNIMAWASKEEEEQDASKSLNTNDMEHTKLNVLEARAAAWEEAEQVKYMARYKREEIKIQAWESNQKIKAEAEMKRIEAKTGRMKSRAHERLMNKLESIKRRAEEQRADAEAKISEQAVKTAHKADYIRQTGHVPSSLFSCNLPALCCGFFR